MALGPLYIIQACLHGVSGGSHRCQDYFAHSQKQWKNCGPLCMLPAKCCFQNQLKGGRFFFFFSIFWTHSVLSISLTDHVLLQYVTLFLLLYLCSTITAELMAQEWSLITPFNVKSVAIKWALFIEFIKNDKAESPLYKHTLMSTTHQSLHHRLWRKIKNSSIFPFLCCICCFYRTT